MCAENDTGLETSAVFVTLRATHGLLVQVRGLDNVEMRQHLCVVAFWAI